jgi:predicted dehydrogenase
VSTPPLRWGIAGPGGIGRQMAAALALVPDAQLVAVGSRSIERARAFADEHGGLRAHGSYEDLVADDEVDVVYVATPHSEHEAHATAALRAGRHVVCEKAFALSAAEARRMAQEARTADRFLMEAMWTWFLPAVRALHERIEAGEIGEVRAIESSFGLAIGGSTGRHRDLAQGGGALLDLGIYPVAFTRLLLGAPSAVRAFGHLGPTGVDDNVGVVLGHPSGAVSTFHAGLDATTTLRATIIGTRGVVEVAAPFWCPTTFTLARSDGHHEVVELPHDGLAHEAAHACERIRAGARESDVIPLATSIAMLETLDDIRDQIGLVFPGRS